MTQIRKPKTKLWTIKHLKLKKMRKKLYKSVIVIKFELCTV